jgi:hypothetical protein
MEHVGEYLKYAQFVLTVIWFLEESIMNMRVLSVLGIASLVVGAALPAVAAPKATTKILPSESATGVPSLTLPTPPVTPNAFTLPVDVQVAKDSSITSSTLITDKYGIGSDIKVWGEDIRKCMMATPKMERVVGKTRVPFVINGKEGILKLNASDKPVCSIY